MLSRATSQMLTFQHRGKPIPLVAADWKDEYVKLTPAERCLRIYRQIIDEETSIRDNGFPKNLKVVDIQFEDVIRDPQGCVSILCDALNMEPNSSIQKIFLRERVPRKYDQMGENEKIKMVSARLSNQSKSEFMELCHNAFNNLR